MSSTRSSFSLDAGGILGPSGSFEREETRSGRRGPQLSNAMSDFDRRIRADGMVSTVKGQTKQSKRIPPWLWLIIAKSLGIRLHDKDKPALAWILHLLTVFSAGSLAFTRIWFSGYDIASVHTNSDVLDGTVSIMMIVLYIGLGVYAHRDQCFKTFLPLAFRLFVHPKFLELMRLHSKTIVKLNAAVVVQIILVGFVIVQNASTVKFLYGRDDNNTTKTDDNSTISTVINPCQTVEIPLLICQSMYLSQAMFSFFFLLWNGMIATVLVSVARTHTISIRRFICQLEIDAHLIDQKLRTYFYQSGSAEARDNLKYYLWLDSDKLHDVLDSSDESQQQTEQPQAHQRGDDEGSVGPEPEVLTNDIEAIEEDAPSSVFSPDVKLKLKEETDERGNNVRRRNPFNIPSRKTVFGRFRRLADRPDEQDEQDDDDDATEPYILSDEEILYKHWKLAFWQKSFIVSWAQIVSWLTRAPNIFDVLSFVLPILILPLIASAYAEVNFEGMKVLQNILPTAKRTSLFRYLFGMPIQMTVYGHPITYGTMGTVLAAIVAAFLSKILLQEMNKIIDG